MFKTLDKAFKELKTKRIEITIITDSEYGHLIKLTKDRKTVMLQRQKSILPAVNKLIKLID